MGTNLKFIPINDLNLIPRYLVEQVKDIDVPVDRFYQMAPVIVGNPLGILGVFCTTDSEVKGFMWATINPLSTNIHCNILSVDKEYQGGTILQEAKGILNRVKKINGCNKITFSTSRPRAMEKAGFKYSKHRMMEV